MKQLFTRRRAEGPRFRVSVYVFVCVCVNVLNVTRVYRVNVYFLCFFFSFRNVHPRGFRTRSSSPDRNQDPATRNDFSRTISILIRSAGNSRERRLSEQLSNVGSRIRTIQSVKFITEREREREKKRREIRSRELNAETTGSPIRFIRLYPLGSEPELFRAGRSGCRRVSPSPDRVRVLKQ